MTRNDQLLEGQWLEERPPYIRGSHCRTDLPSGAVYLYSVIEEYIPETGETQVFETWVCS